MKNTVDIRLGTAPDVYQLFSFANPALALTDVISHGFNQTLQRDMYYGSWADAYIHGNGDYRVKLTSPTDDMSPYEKLIPNYIKAGQIAMQTYNKKVTQAQGFQFLLPFGLAMANVQSVQLFHFPPNETFYYSDYLYSPTNRRWETLLAQNGFDGRDNTVVERIIDVVPIAAAGGAMKQIAPYNFDFTSYGKKQLTNFLTKKKRVTQPIVAYGGPVRDWLWKVYKKQIQAQVPAKDGAKAGANPLGVLSIVKLEIIKGAKTPVLCANHPSMYLYDTNLPVDGSAQKQTTSSTQSDDYPSPVTVMRQDLIAAGWQAVMARKWDTDPERTKKTMEKRWASTAKVKKIMREQNTEFGYAQ